MARGGGTAVLLAAGVLTLVGAALWLALAGGTTPGPAGALESEPERAPTESVMPAPAETTPPTAAPRGRRGPVRTEPQPFDAVAMEGRVRKGNGRPLADAAVMLAGQRTRTDVKGWFRFEAIPPGEHQYVVAADGHFLHDRKVRIPGDTLDVRLSSVKRMGGVLRAPDGTPLEGFTVRILRKGQWGKDAVTDAEGRWGVEGIPGGQFTIAVSPGRRGEERFLPLWSRRTFGGKTDVELTMAAGSTITGTVVGPDGQPVADARVAAQIQGKNYARANFVAHSDEQGVFEVIVPPETVFDLLVETPTDRLEGYRFVAWKRKGVAAGATAVAVELRPGETVGGRLVDEAGRAVGGQDLDLISHSTAPWFNSAYILRAQARTKPDGTFLFGGLPKIEYEVRLRGARPGIDGFVLLGAVRVAPGTTDLRVRRISAQEFSGTLVTDEGAKLPGRLLILRHEGSSFRAYTRAGKDGTFTFQHLAPGSYKVRIYANVKGRWGFHGLPPIRSGAAGVELVGTP